MKYKHLAFIIYTGILVSLWINALTQRNDYALKNQQCLQTIKLYNGAIK